LLLFRLLLARLATTTPAFEEIEHVVLRAAVLTEYVNTDEKDIVEGGPTCRVELVLPLTIDPRLTAWRATNNTRLAMVIGPMVPSIPEMTYTAASNFNEANTPTKPTSNSGRRLT